MGIKLNLGGLKKPQNDSENETSNNIKISTAGLMKNSTPEESESSEGIKLNLSGLKKSNEEEPKTPNETGFKISFTENKEYNLDDIIYKKRRNNDASPLLLKVNLNNKNDEQVIHLITGFIFEDYGVEYDDINWKEQIKLVPNFEEVFDQYFNKYYSIYDADYNKFKEGSISLNTIIEKITLSHSDYESYLTSNYSRDFSEIGNDQQYNKTQVSWESGSEDGTPAENIDANFFNIGTIVNPLPLYEQDLNEVLIPGAYSAISGNLCVNKPNEVDDFALLVISMGENILKQTLITKEKKVYNRIFIEDTWTDFTDEDIITDEIIEELNNINEKLQNQVTRVEYNPDEKILSFDITSNGIEQTYDCDLINEAVTNISYDNKKLIIEYSDDSSIPINLSDIIYGLVTKDGLDLLLEEVNEKYNELSDSIDELDGKYEKLENDIESKYIDSKEESKEYTDSEIATLKISSELFAVNIKDDINEDLKYYVKKNDITNVYKFQGTLQTYEDLFTIEKSKGDVYNIIQANGDIPAGTNYAWDGTHWDVLGGNIDLTAYYTSQEVDSKDTGTLTSANLYSDDILDQSKEYINTKIGDIPLNEYSKITDTDEKISAIKTEINNNINNELTNYYTSSAINTKLESIIENTTEEINNVVENKIHGLEEDINLKQDILNSGVNIKTINGESILGSGDIEIIGGDNIAPKYEYITLEDFTYGDTDQLVEAGLYLLQNNLNGYYQIKEIQNGQHTGYARIKPFDFFGDIVRTEIEIIKFDSLISNTISIDVDMSTLEIVRSHLTTNDVPYFYSNQPYHSGTIITTGLDGNRSVAVSEIVLDDVITRQNINTYTNDFYNKNEINNKTNKLEEDIQTIQNEYAKKSDITTVYKYAGSVNTYELLQQNGIKIIGNVYNVVSSNGNIPSGTNYVWDGAHWDALGGSVDLSNYSTTTEINQKDSTILESSKSYVDAKITPLKNEFDEFSENTTEELSTINNTLLQKQNNIQAGRSITITDNVIDTAISLDTIAANSDESLERVLTLTDSFNSFKSVVNPIIDNFGSKQDKLISGNNIKTINGESVLGSGNLEIQGGGGSGGLAEIVEILSGAGTSTNPYVIDKAFEDEKLYMFKVRFSNITGNIIQNSSVYFTYNNETLYVRIYALTFQTSTNPNLEATRLNILLPRGYNNRMKVVFSPFFTYDSINKYINFNERRSFTNGQTNGLIYTDGNTISNNYKLMDKGKNGQGLRSSGTSNPYWSDLKTFIYDTGQTLEQKLETLSNNNITNDIVVHSNFDELFLAMEPNKTYALFNQTNMVVPFPQNFSPSPENWETYPPLGEYKLEISNTDQIEVALALPKEDFIINSNKELSYGTTIVDFYGPMNMDTIILPANSRVSVSILLDRMLIYFWEK